MVGIGDAVFGGVVLLFLIFGFRRGMSFGIFSAAGFVLVVVLAVLLATPLGGVIGKLFHWGELTLSTVGFFVVLGVGLIVLLLLRGLLKESLRGQRGRVVDTMTGTLLWGALGLVFLVLCLSVLLVSHNGVFTNVAYKRSAACRFIFDKVPVMRELKTRVERPRTPRSKTPTDLQELERGFRRTTEDDDSSEKDR